MMMSVAGKQASRSRRLVPLLIIAAVLGLLIASSSGVSAARAHAELLETTPEEGAVLEAAPDTVELRFNEPVRIIDDAIRLFPGDGTEPTALAARSVDSTVSIDLPAELPDGSYALSYRIVSADGHPVGGALTFQVGEGDFPAPQVTSTVNPVVAEWFVIVLTGLQYLGLLVFAGLLFFDRVVLATRGPGDPRIRKLIRYAFATASAAALLLVPASGSRVSGNEFISYIPESGDVVLPPAETWWSGVSWQVLATAALVSGTGLAGLLISGRARSLTGGLIAVGLASIALFSPVLVGHTQTIHPVWMMIIADMGHLAAGAFWAGGLIGLLSYLRRASPGVRLERDRAAAGSGVRAAPRAEPRIAPRLVAEVVADFSRFALFSVIVLASSGLLMAVLILDSWSALISTEYGRALLIKLGLVAVIVVLAAWNRMRLVPKIMAQPGAEQQWLSLRRIMSCEAALLIAVVAVTGFLTNTSPNDATSRTGVEAGDSASQEMSASTESQGLRVEGTLTPGSSGQNEWRFTLEYEDELLTPDVLPIESITVEARLPEQQIGPIAATVEFDESSGEYVAALSLPVSGEWQLQVAPRIDVYTQPIALLSVVVG